jgi:hypothetical protein
MLIEDFAKQHRLKTGIDECGERIVPGTRGQVYEWSLDASKFGVMFMPRKTTAEPWGKWSPKRWGNFRRAGVAAGMTILQNGDSEGCLAFDPANKTQFKLAVKIAGVRPKRRVSPEQAAAGSARLVVARQRRQNSSLDPQQEALLGV